MNDARFDQLFSITSILSLVFQIAGTALIALMSYIVARAVGRRQMLLWVAGWSSYAVALVAILLANRVDPPSGALLFAYFFLEYVAVLLIFAGCRYEVTDKPLARWTWSIIAPAALIAFALAALSPAFISSFTIHTAIIGLAWAACLIGLWPALRRSQSRPGVRIVAAGLALLAIDYALHSATAIYVAAHHLTLSPYFYTVTSLVDGMLEFVLGFGSVVLIVDKVRADLEQANASLKYAQAKTEQALHVDQLTGVFNRYSFSVTYDRADNRRARGGCVVVADLDDLKRVNDTRGHAIGDQAIRAVARGLSSLVRGDDRVYRFGGDEFVIVMAGMQLELARRRMEGLAGAVNFCMESDGAAAENLAVSYGVAEFGGEVAIESAIAAADAAMYSAKSGRESKRDDG